MRKSRPTPDGVATALKKKLNNNINAQKAQQTAAPTQNSVGGNAASASAPVKKGTRVNNNNVFYANVGDNKVAYVLSNESISNINVNKPRVLTAKDYNLISATRRVRMQPLFGQHSMEELEELAKDYPFSPFDYQRRNVDTMLNHYDARGIFGDQVGLGKTIEALMTAHAMFRCGAIRNALIVVPKKVLPGWLNEINNKFPNIFDVVYLGKVTARGKIDTFEKLLLTMDRENRIAEETGTGKYRLYIVSESMLKLSHDQIHKANEEAASYETADAIFREMESAGFKAMKDGLLGKVDATTNLTCGANIEKTLYEYGWKNDEFEIGGEQILTHVGIKACEFVIKMLEEVKSGLLQKKARYSRNTKIDLCIEQADRYIAEFKAEIENINKIKENDKVYVKLLGRNGERIIDLLIVDEVHDFFSGEEDGKKKPGDEEDFTIVEEYRNTVDLLADISKKYTVLMSATPVRTRLEDIFDLIYIADKERLGEDRERSQEYFYNTICKVDPDERFKLTELMSDPDKRRNFFGLLNNYFTRNRIHEVGDTMCGKDIATSQKLMAFAREYRDEIIQKRKTMYLQTGSDSRFSAREAEADYNAWINGTLSNESKKRHMRSAVDAVLIEVASGYKIEKNAKAPDSINYRQDLIEERRAAHSLADWRRRSKEGILIKIPTSRCRDKYQEVLMSTCSIDKTLEELAVKLSECDPDQVSDILKEYRFAYSDMKNCDPSDLSNVLSQVVAGYHTAIVHGPAVCYVSRDRIDGRNGLRDSIDNELSKRYPDKEVVAVSDNSMLPEVNATRHNPFIIVNQGFQAGVNLQQYRTIVFAQMDWKGQRLLEPVDIEQWIGRIHRTGQVRTSRVITVLNTAMSQGNDPSEGFLEWYYSVLADEQGFDLYGNNTPDVAFLQPIVVDCLRAALCKLDESAETHKTLQKAVASSNLVSNKTIDKCSFSQLLQICYEYAALIGDSGPKDMVTKYIREMCSLPEFGKKKN